MIEMQIPRNGIAEFRALSKRFKQAARGDLRRELNAHLRREGAPMVGGVKGAALGLPATTGQSTGLRARMAAATRLSITATGIRVVVSERRMGDQAFAPRATNAGRWKHPVYGNRQNWVTQTSQRGWFYDECYSHAPALRNAVSDAIDVIAARIGG